MAWGKETLCTGVAGCAFTEERETTEMMGKRISQRIISLVRDDTKSPLLDPTITFQSENHRRDNISRVVQPGQPRNSTERIQKEKERISTTPFLLWHFSPGDKIENCSAQFLAVCWIVRVEFKV